MNNSSDAEGSSGAGKSKRGRSRYRPYLWRGRGRGGRGRSGPSGSLRGKTAAAAARNQRSIMMPPPTPQAVMGSFSNPSSSGTAAESNFTFSSMTNGDVSYDENSSSSSYRSLTSSSRGRPKQPKIDSLVLSQLTQKYPGYYIYFPTPSTISNLLDKVDVTKEYLSRQQTIPNVEAAYAFEEKEYFEITYEKILEDNEFMRDWSSFETELVNKPEEVINIWGLAMYTVRKILFQFDI